MENRKMNCPDILKKIVATKREELCALREKKRNYQSMAADLPPALDFKKALSGPSISVIAEIKKASPSAGVIATDFNPAKIAEAYSKGKTDAVSVLTDKYYFKGDISYIPLVRPILNVPILRKDFIIDSIQILEARANGADSFLLISAILEVEQLREMLELGRSLGMEALVESHDETELRKSIKAGATIFGVNNRDLRDFTVDITQSERLVKLIPKGCVAVSESGIKTPTQSSKLRTAGFDAILVGESLMRSGIDSAPRLIHEFKTMTPNNGRPL
jgi:indole-3-glycerol phosphate synthase